MPVSRRALIFTGIAAGGGLGIWYAGERLDDGAAAEKFAASTDGAAALNAWLKITPAGEIICGVHRAEMGQGVTTTLPMLLAEELDADWSRVRYEFTPVDRDYFNFGILANGRPFGPIEGRPAAAAGTALLRRVFHAMGLSLTISSASTVDAWDSLRVAGAAARAMLVDAAAARWGVPAGQLRTAEGRVWNDTTGLSLDYGELAAEAATQKPPGDPPLKDPSRWEICGTSVPRLDIPAKVRGEAVYAADLRLPGMRYATVRHSPVAGGRVAGFEENDALAVPGVERVLALDDLAVGVVATNTWAAFEGARRLQIRNRENSGAAGLDSPALFQSYRDALDQADRPVFREEGAVDEILAPARWLESEFQLAFLAHLCMEPMSCTALLDDTGLQVWAPTQSNSLTRDVAARISGLDPARVRVHRVLMGGGFGRRAEMDFVEHAVRLAKAMPGTPVQLTYSREEDVQHDMYRPALLARVRGQLNEDGRITAFSYDAVTQSVTASYNARTPNPRGGDAEGDGSMVSAARNWPYAVPHVRVTAVAQDPGVPVGFWRSPGSSSNGFPVEVFMDELAEAAGTDPLDFRLQHLEDMPRHRAVLQAAAELADWQAPLPAGRGRGIALTASSGSVCAQVVEVQLEDEQIRVRRVSCAMDCGRIIHPDGLEAQVQSSIVDGLSAALYGEITFRDGQVQQNNFSDYRLLRLADTPRIDVQLLASGGRPGGAGEPALPAAAPALANAVRAAGGPRLHSLPLERAWRAARERGAWPASVTDSAGQG